MKKYIKRFIPLSLIKKVKKILIYMPFEKGDSFNGNILIQHNYLKKHHAKVAIFSHYDRDNIIDEYVINYLKSIFELGFDIVFISTAEQLSQNEIDKIKVYCRDVLVKENIGYDFGAWQTGITYLAEEIDKYDSLILCNDSVYAPLFSLNEMFIKMQGKYDFWGITDSYEIHHHLQSYFMVFNQNVVSSDTFKNIWKTYRVYKIKRNIILQYEIGLSQKLLINGYSMGAYCPYSELETTQVCNASHYYWRELIEQFRCPILKIELLRDNPQNIDISGWELIHCDYEIKLIKKHLARVWDDHSLLDTN